MTVARVRGPWIRQVRHPQLPDSPQSLELPGVEQSEEQAVERPLDLERDHVVHRVANDLLRHGRYYVQATTRCHTDKETGRMNRRQVIFALSTLIAFLAIAPAIVLS